jgi:hypothetical protein
VAALHQQLLDHRLRRLRLAAPNGAAGVGYDAASAAAAEGTQKEEGGMTPKEKAQLVIDSHVHRQSVDRLRLHSIPEEEKLSILAGYRRGVADMEEGRLKAKAAEKLKTTVTKPE